MATQNYTITLTQVSGGNYVPVTTGSYALRIDPFSANTYTGTHLGNGVWQFADVQDGVYQLWDITGTAAQVSKWGTKFIGDKTLNLSDLYVEGTLYADSNGIYAVGKTLTLSGNALSDSLVCSGQANFHSSVNFNSNDIVHVDNLQVNTLSENVGSAGITFNSPAKFTAGISANSISGTFVDVPTLTGSNAYYGRNYYYGGITLGSSTADPTKQPTNYIYGLTNFVFKAPFCGEDPNNDNQLTRRSYVTGRINSIVSALSAYNQDYQVIRLHPNGVAETGKVYTTWATAMAYAITKTPTSANQICIEIEGLGNAAEINIAVHGGGTSAFYEYVHVKGTTPNIRVNLQPISFTGITASAVSAMVYENINFYGTGDNTMSFSNITFKNCTFESTTDSIGQFYMFDFSNCKFVGGNYFYGPHAFNFVECIGDTVIVSKTPVVSGTNTIKYFNTSNATALETHSLSAKGIVSATAMTVGGTSLTGDGSQLYIGGELKTSAGCIFAGETAISGRLNATGDVRFISNDITEKAVNTIGLSGTEICLSAATLNLVGLTDNVTPSEGNTSGPMPPNYYGKSESYVLFEPDKFIQVQIGGTNYLIPLYVKA